MVNILVRRGELYFSFEFLDSWATDIAQMNEGKVGRRYEFPEPFIQHLMMLHIILNASYRSLEGMVRKLSTYIPAIQPIDYTTIWKRGTKLDLELSDTIVESNEPVVIAIDSSVIKVTNRGEWMREVWKVHRGWIKVHIAVNVKTKEVVGIEVTDEKVGDSRMFGPLIDQSKEILHGRKIEQADADGAYDTREAFNKLAENNIMPAIKIRSNTSTKARGSPLRAKHAREYLEMGYKSWKKKYDYGKRWAVEGAFSLVKRIMGESVSATKTENMFHEVGLKFKFANILINA
ncbi:MAG: IS5 family transposase [Methanothrix sp.]|nr:IS5 family transposase [Methanothrix sp.]